MPRIDKTLVVLTAQEVEKIELAVMRRDRTAALSVVTKLLGKKVELMLKRRCK